MRRIRFEAVRMFVERQCRSMPSRFVYSNNEPTNHDSTERQSHVNTINIGAAIAVRSLISAARALRKTLNISFCSIACTTATLTLFNSLSVAQQSGGLDSATYGPYPGLAYGAFPPITEQRFVMHDAIVLSDDRVVAGGTCVAVGASPAGNRFCLAVWSASGGVVTLYVHSTSVNRVSDGSGGALAQQADGKIVVTAPCVFQATDTVNQFCTVRFNADFTSDTGFAVGSFNTSPSPSTTTGNSYANAIAIQSDGKIVVAGQCGTTGANAFFCAARLLPNGNPDTTFGGGNSLRLFLGINNTIAFDRVKRVAIAPDGKIYLGGDCKQDASSLFRPCVARLNADGSIDTAFNGTTVKPLTLPAMSGGSTDDEVTDMVVQANGEFVFAGNCKNASSTIQVPCALRMGAPNATQFTPGTHYLGAEQSTGTSIIREPVVAGFAISMQRIFLQPDGKMLALLRYGLNNTEYRLRRYNEDGSRDANWAENAFDFNMSADGATFARGVALGQQSSGKVMAMGFTAGGTSGQGQARVIRLENRANPGRNCSADIDGDGKVLPTTDGLLLARASLGMTGNSVISGTTGAGARRSTWPAIRDFLITQCGMQTILP
jgi:uncharacterized delta-60 repeat protein